MHLFMASSSSYTLTEDLNNLHAMYRMLYTLLVIDLVRDPVESMQALALWLWLEKASCYNVIERILSLPRVLVDELADEAVISLKCIDNPLFFASSSVKEIPLTHGLMKKQISLRFFYENRIVAKKEIHKIIIDFCITAFKDIMREALERIVARNISKFEMLMLSHAADGSTSGVAPLGHGTEIPQRRIRVNDVPPLDTTIPSPAVDESLISGFSQLGLGSQIPQRVLNEVPPDDRTMFVTFSKGYPVTEWEVRKFFRKIFGDCIESIHMQEVRPCEQSLYARIVFYTPSIIEQILNGEIKAKFSINGKHVWMRKFVPKYSSSNPALMLPDSIPGSV